MEMQFFDKEAGAAHLEIVWSKYTKWLCEDLEDYKQRLVQAIGESEIYGERSAAYWYTLALMGMRREMERFLDKMGQDKIQADVHCILNEIEE